MAREFNYKSIVFCFDPFDLHAFYGLPFNCVCQLKEVEIKHVWLMATMLQSCEGEGEDAGVRPAEFDWNKSGLTDPLAADNGEFETVEYSLTMCSLHSTKRFLFRRSLVSPRY